MSNSNIIEISVVIPTYGRDKILLETIGFLLDQSPKAREILVVDQTMQHSPDTENQLTAWHKHHEINWFCLERPSITKAMNMGLLEASCPIVLFLDDDIVPVPGLVGAHAECYFNPDVWAVTGQVLQSGQEAEDVKYSGSAAGIGAFIDFPFYSTIADNIKNVMAGNLSVRREKALEIGGFDENFIGVSYRFETEFAGRIVRDGGVILFQPKASIRHLRAESGGTREKGSHLNSISPLHGVGDYYFALRQKLSLQTLWYMLKRPFREVMTKFHLGHPWYIPIKFFGELRAFAMAVNINRKGPKYIQQNIATPSRNR